MLQISGTYVLKTGSAKACLPNVRARNLQEVTSLENFAMPDLQVVDGLELC